MENTFVAKSSKWRNGIVTIVNYSSFDNLFNFYFDPVIIVYCCRYFLLPLQKNPSSALRTRSAKKSRADLMRNNSLAEHSLRQIGD